MKVNMLDTPYCKRAHLREIASQTAAFLVEKQQLVALTNDDLANLKSLRIMLSNPVSDIAQRIIDTNKLDQYLFTNLANYNASVPELLTMTELTIDGKNLDTTVASLNRAWFNLTPFIAKRSQQVVLTDIPSFCSQLMRGMLIMSYNDSDAWLSPQLASFVIESYSMTISMILNRMYVLDPNEQKILQTLVGAYMAQMIGGSAQNQEVPELLFRCSSLESVAQIKNRLDIFKDAREKLDNNYQLSWDIIGQLIREAGPERMRDFKTEVFSRLFSGSPVDSISMIIGMNYPPYWVNEVLKTASGTKIGHIVTVLKLNSFKKELPNFVSGLLKYEGFIRNVER